MKILPQSLFQKIIWGFVIVTLLVIACVAMRACYKYRQLEAGSCRIKAVIEKVERRHHEEHMQKVGKHRYRKMPAYTETIIYYTWTVDGTEYHDDVSTRHPMLRRIGQGDSIPMDYALSNPGISRAYPDSIRVRRRRAFAY
ncbi:MAG: hypothetical protein K2G47_03080 [Muribaculum sp.]|nr:hypothetical protein [Muribaculum sp.]